MITNALLFLLTTFLNGIIALLSRSPDVSPNSAIVSAVTTASGYYSAVNSYVPLDTVIQIAAFVLVFELLYFGYKLIRWAYSKVPGVT